MLNVIEMWPLLYIYGHKEALVNHRARNVVTARKSNKSKTATI